jgi:hypothetical protein
MMTTWKAFRSDFTHEAKRQQEFTNSFWRQLLVIVVSIIVIQLVGPYVINLTAVHGDLPFEQRNF